MALILFIIASIIVILSENLIYSILALIFRIFILGLIFILNGYIFIGLSLISIYIGAIIILFRLIVFIFNTQLDTFKTKKSKNSTLFGIIIITALIAILSKANIKINPSDAIKQKQPINLHDIRILENFTFSQIKILGIELVSVHPSLFIMIGISLLLSMILIVHRVLKINN